MVGLERCEDGLDVLICLFAGQTAVVRTQDKVERHALLADGHAGAAVNIEQRHILEKALRAAADALFERADRDGLVAHDGDVARDGGELRKRLVDRDVAALFICLLYTSDAADEL